MTTSVYKGSIFKELFMLIFITTSMLFIFGYSFFVYKFIQNEIIQNKKLSISIEKTISQDLAKLILLNDIYSAADITTKLKSFDKIVSVVVFNKKGTPIYQYSKNAKSFKVKDIPKSTGYKVEGDIFDTNIKAIYMDRKLGMINMKIRRKTIAQILKENMEFIATSYIFILIVSYLLAYLYARYFTEPIIKLVKFLDTIEWTSSLKKRVSISEDNEFGKLYEEVNIMLSKLESAYDEQKIATVAFETQSGIIIAGIDDKILQVNQAFTKITGYKKGEVIGKNASILRSKLHQDKFYEYINSRVKKEHFYSGEILFKDKYKNIKNLSLTIQPVFDDKNRINYYVYSFLDITRQKEIEAKLKYLQQYDPLTGLANRNLFIDTLRSRINSTISKKRWHALLCIDIDDFKSINDIYGHEIGDWILRELAQRLKEEFKDSDFIGKIGIDEFIISKRNIGDTKDEAFKNSEKVIERVYKITKHSFDIDYNTINISIKVGLNIYNYIEKDANLVLKRADSALQIAKRENKKIAFFDKEMEQKSLKYFQIYNQLLTAVKEKQFELYYQMQYKDDESIYGAEALIRWNHPEKSIISPINFIEIAENKNLIIDIGDWVMDEGCKQLALWQKDSKTSKWVMAINVSAKQFHQNDFVNKVIDKVKKYKIAPSRLKLELTESLIVNDFRNVISKMKYLRKYGIQISIDDFGTGYSSLQYLKNFPVDQIKIDQTFIFNLTRSKEDTAIVKSIIDLGTALGYEVVAEGVETKEHFKLLKKLGCKYYQGYYFAKPVKLSELVFKNPPK